MQGRIIKTIGVIINCVKYLDNSIILTIVTPNLGKITAISKKNKKETLPIMQTFSFCEFVLFKGQSMYHVNEVIQKESFYEFTQDYDKIVCASNIVKYVNKYYESQYMDDNEKYLIFKLIVSSFYIILSHQKNYDQIQATFILKFFYLIGMFVNLDKDNIQEIGEKEIVFLDEKIQTTKVVYKVVEYIYKSEIPQCYNFSLLDSQNEQFQNFVKHFTSSIS